MTTIDHLAAAKTLAAYFPPELQGNKQSTVKKKKKTKTNNINRKSLKVR